MDEDIKFWKDNHQFPAVVGMVLTLKKEQTDAAIYNNLDENDQHAFIRAMKYFYFYVGQLADFIKADKKERQFEVIESMRLGCLHILQTLIARSEARINITE
jgi:hypothetical protein